MVDLNVSNNFNCDQYEHFYDEDSNVFNDMGHKEFSSFLKIDFYFINHGYKNCYDF